MKTLIVPCGGRSSRFPNMRPKWMLTHPSGRLMVEMALDGFEFENYDRVIITIVKEHVEKYAADIVLKQVFGEKVEICILEEFTSSASETICKTVNIMNVYGEVVIKDSDNYVNCDLPKTTRNAIIGYDLRVHKDVPNIPAKSFLVVNKKGVIESIVEKEVISNIICLGVYCFEDISLFVESYHHAKAEFGGGELYVSHIIQHMVGMKNIEFEYIPADDYRDWGTLNEWKTEQERHKAFFVDFDGVLVKNVGRYGKENWSNTCVPLRENLQVLKKLYKHGAKIIITTARTEEFECIIRELLSEYDITPHAIVMNLPHSARVLINDYAPSNPYPSARAINLSRDGLLKYLLDGEN